MALRRYPPKLAAVLDRVETETAMLVVVISMVDILASLTRLIIHRGQSKKAYSSYAVRGAEKPEQQKRGVSLPAWRQDS